jgi:hypothetical protein
MKAFWIIFLMMAATTPVFGGIVDNGDGTLTDTSTNLMWQKSSSLSVTRSQADKYIEQLNWGTFSDWRYPTDSEFFSMFMPTSGCYWYTHQELGICFYSYGPEVAFIQYAKVFAVREAIMPEPKIYTQSDMDNALLNEKSKWDIDNDEKIGLPEAIHALQVIAEMRPQP